MRKDLLNIYNLCVSVEGKPILKELNLKIRPGEIHVLMGPNGAGKSTLANVIMGDPKFCVESGSIIFDGDYITEDSPDERARKGLFLSFQSPEEVPGITMENFLRGAKAAHTGNEIKLLPFHKELQKKMKDLDIDDSYASRYLNVGFSGGEKKKSEILQMLVLNPKLAILDETDSGLDVDAVKTISESIRSFQNKSNGVLIITHITRILQSLPIDFVHVMAQGRIVTTGDTSLVEKISQDGFTSILS